MPSRVTIYCRQSVEHLTENDILAALEEVDWHLAAEFEGVEDEAEMDEALKYFSLKPGEQSWFELSYRPPGKRQFTIDLSPPDPEAIEEILEELPDDDSPAGTAVRHHLSTCQEVVTIETGFMQFVGVAPVFAFQVARVFAEVGDGLIEAVDQSWWKPDGSWFGEQVYPVETS